MLALVWIAGPLSGTLVQPYVGMKSDNCRMRWGRRRPFIVGGAIATITAISKGRSIGKMEKPDPGEAQEKSRKRKEKAEEAGLEEIETMSFKLRLDKEGVAMVGDKPKKAAEESLRKKYGGDANYGKVKGVFEEALKSWKGKEEELDGRAFGMYEDFRPTIPPGQQEWGRKGQLRLETIKEVVSAG